MSMKLSTYLKRLIRYHKDEHLKTFSLHPIHYANAFLIVVASYD